MVLDGGNGTELERLGVRMDQEVWCARALVDFPEIVHQVHRRYIDAGADVITANSFAAGLKPEPQSLAVAAERVSSTYLPSQKDCRASDDGHSCTTDGFGKQHCHLRPA